MIDEELSMTNGIQTGRRLFVALTALVFCFAVASNAIARGGERGNSGASYTEQEVIDEVNVAGQTVTIAGETYRVSESSRLFDERGGRIRLFELNGSAGSSDGDMVEFTVRRSGDGRRNEIRRLAVIAGDFE
jgi:hypothetical protein